MNLLNRELQPEKRTKPYPKPTTRRATFKPDNAEFVTVWLKSSTAQAVADHFNVAVHQVQNKARSLRRQGVHLPKKSGRQLDEVTKLNKIVERYSK